MDFTNGENVPYTYDHLDAKTLANLERDLNEIPKQTQPHINSFRRWIASMQHLTCPTDDKFLLKFLRVAKFDHGRAEKRLDNFCTIRGSPRGITQWFSSEVNEEHVNTLLRKKVIVPLGYNDEGEIVILVKLKSWNADVEKLQDMLPVIYRMIDVLVDDEHMQINGFSAIIDMEGMGHKHIKAWANISLIRNWTRAWQEAYPIRVKSTFYYNEPLLFDILYKMMEFFQDEKLRKRIHRVKDNFYKIHSKMPGIKKILPTEYGGDGGSFDECAERWEKRFREYYANGHPLNGIKVDESKRPESTRKFLRKYGEYKGKTLDDNGTSTN